MVFLPDSRERSRTRRFRGDDLPKAESPPHRLDLDGNPDDIVRRVVVLPDGGRIATACFDGHVRVYDARGDGEPLVDIHAHAEWVDGLAVLGDHFLASASSADCEIHTWDARTGERMDRMDVGGFVGVTALAAVGREFLVAGVIGGDVEFIKHKCGRLLPEGPSVKRAHSEMITDIAWHEDVLLTASEDKTVRVWSVSTCKPLAVLDGNSVGCAAVNSRYIATGSEDNTLRLYANGTGFPLVYILDGLHTSRINAVQFIGSDLIMSAGSYTDSVCFTAVSPDARPVARLSMEFSYNEVNDMAVTADGRVAWAGDGASICALPIAVADAVKEPAMATFRSVSSAVVQQKLSPPLQVASADAQAGRVAGGDASRRLKLRELEALALCADEIRKLDVEQSSCLLAAAMVMFKKRYAKQYAVIERGIFRAFDRSLVNGESLVDTLDVDQAFRIAKSGLNDEGEYIAMEVDTRAVLEGRLRSYLIGLRRRFS